MLGNNRKLLVNNGRLLRSSNKRLFTLDISSTYGSFWLSTDIPTYITIMWGDGITEVFNVNGDTVISHNYAANGYYAVSIINPELITKIDRITQIVSTVGSLKAYKSLKYLDLRDGNATGIIEISEQVANQLEYVDLHYTTICIDTSKFTNNTVLTYFQMYGNYSFNYPVLDISNILKSPVLKIFIISGGQTAIGNTNGLVNNHILEKFETYYCRDLSINIQDLKNAAPTLQNMRTVSSGIINNDYSGFIFAKLKLLYTQVHAVLNLDEIVLGLNPAEDNYYLSISATDYGTGDLSVFSNVVGKSFVYLYLSSDFTGSLAMLNGIIVKARFYFNSSLATGTLQDIVNIASPTLDYINIQYSRLTGSWSVLTNNNFKYVYAYDLVNSLTDWDYLLDSTKLKTFYMQRSNTSTQELDKFANKLYNNRNIYDLSVVKTYKLEGNAGLTGTYQNPIGTAIHDYTEEQVDALTLTPLEQVWVLMNLQASTSNTALRYNFLITY